MATWNIYKAERIWKRAANGNYYQHVISLEMVASGLKSFSRNCWPIVEKLKKELVINGATEGPLSRGSDYCIDHLNRPATDADKERDDMIPGVIGIDIISTPSVLSLKFVD